MCAKSLLCCFREYSETVYLSKTFFDRQTAILIPQISSVVQGSCRLKLLSLDQ